MKSIFPSRRLYNRLRRYSSASAAVIRGGAWDIDGGDYESSSSSVYEHKLKFQKPTTIKYRNQPLNSTSFIGRILKPLNKCNTTNGDFGVYTTLVVAPSPYSIYVSLTMWSEMAEIAMEHLKPNDFVYVCGKLISFSALWRNKRTLRYQLYVEEINFVTPIDQGQAPTSTMPRKVEFTDEDREDKYRMKLHLWQVFFSNPIEWRDLRKCKKNPRQPDFKHKDTGEALWLGRDDPPWIQRQLQLLDSRMGGLNFERHRNSRSMVSDFGNYI